MARRIPRRRLVGVATTALLGAAALGGPASTALATTTQPAHIICAAGTSSVIVGCCPTPPPPCRRPLPVSTASSTTIMCVEPQTAIACPLASSDAQSGLVVRCCPGPVAY
jgi:hypothetical protein